MDLFRRRRRGSAPVPSHLRHAQPKRSNSCTTYTTEQKQLPSTSMDAGLEESERKLFEMCSRRDEWTKSRGDEPALELRGTWNATHRVAGGREVLQLLRVHVRNGVNVAFLLSDGDAGGALMAGEPVFQVDGQDRTLTSFGAPAYGALVVDKAVGSAPSSECWARCEVIPSGNPLVLFFYQGRRCVLRCWRHAPAVGCGGTATSSVNSAPAERNDRAEPDVRQRQRAVRGGGSRGAGAPGGDGEHAGSVEPLGVAARRHAESGDGDKAAAAKRVREWATGKDLRAMLVTLSQLVHGFGAPPADSGGAPAVRRAYHRACLQLHPDRHAGSSERTKVIAEELFKALSAAYIEHCEATSASGLCSAAMAC